jgi:hypothetical protein
MYKKQKDRWLEKRKKLQREECVMSEKDKIEL